MLPNTFAKFTFIDLGWSLMSLYNKIVIISSAIQLRILGLSQFGFEIFHMIIFLNV